MENWKNPEKTQRFDPALLACYQNLLQTTQLQKAYQEWFRWFRFLRGELEKQMPEFKFQAAVAENGMDYAYFQFVSPSLKEKGLKIVVAFLHGDFCLEVWLSGVNRKSQALWWEKLPSAPTSFSRTVDPLHTDYILRAPVPVDWAEGEAAVAAVRQTVQRLLDEVQTWL